MTRKVSTPQSRHHVILFDEDWEFLDKFYGQGSGSRIGTGPAIRAIVHTFVRNLKARSAGEIEATMQRITGNAEGGH